MRVILLGLLCTLYVWGQNPDPVVSVGGGGGSGGSGSGTVSGTTGQVACFDAITSVGDCTAGTGIAIAAGAISVDLAVIPRFSTGAGAPAATCTGGAQFYTDLTANALYFCDDTDTWQRVQDYNGNIVTAAGTLTADLPVIGGGSKAVAVGTRSGNTNQYVTTTGTQTSGDCVSIDANGNHVASGSACGGGSSFDPISNFRLFEDFAGGTTASGSLGSHGFLYGGGTTLFQASEVGAPGILRKATSTASGTLSQVYSPNVVRSTLHSTDNFDVIFRIRVNQIDANTSVRVGLNCDPTSVSTNPPASGIYIERLDADTNWFGVTRSASSQTRTDTSQAATTSWVKLRVRRVDASTIGFTVDSSSEVTATATIPAVGCVVHGMIINSTTADKTMDYDYISAAISGLTR